MRMFAKRKIGAKIFSNNALTSAFFYVLCGNSSVSCGGCHAQTNRFADIARRVNPFHRSPLSLIRFDIAGFIQFNLSAKGFGVRRDADTNEHTFGFDGFQLARLNFFDN